MTDLLIRNIEAQLKRLLEQRARTHRRSLSEEAKTLIRKALREPKLEEKEGRKLGTAMLELVRSKDRGEDLVFEASEPVRKPADFK
jgi:plasmid stability protein